MGALTVLVAIVLLIVVVAVVVIRAVSTTVMVMVVVDGQLRALLMLNSALLHTIVCEC